MPFYVSFLFRQQLLDGVFHLFRRGLRRKTGYHIAMAIHQKFRKIPLNGIAENAALLLF